MVFARQAGLLRRFREGEVAALERVYWAYVDQVTRVVHAVVRSRSRESGAAAGDVTVELADIVQDVFVKAFAPQARQGFDGDRPYGPYLAQIARNVVVDHWRVTQRQVPLDLDLLLDDLSMEADASRREAEGWADLQTMATVDRYLAGLPPEMREVHEALYAKGLSQREAAAALGLGRQAIRGLEAKLRVGLRQELQRLGQMEGDDGPVLEAFPAVRGGNR